jgi:phosphonate transport system substrate-binding protein
MNDDMKAKFKQFMVDLPKTDAACFASIQGGEFTGYTEVNVDFYKPIIDARKATIGG